MVILESETPGQFASSAGPTVSNVQGMLDVPPMQNGSRGFILCDQSLLSRITAMCVCLADMLLNLSDGIKLRQRVDLCLYSNMVYFA